MAFDPEVHHRRSIRLKGYDYAQPGMYFVTICLDHRRCLLGEICDGRPLLSDAGKMVEIWWCELPRKFPFVELDAHVVMPNHIHGILFLDARQKRHRAGASSAQQPSEVTLSQILQWFKTMTTNAYLRAVKDHGWPRVEKKFWQRNFYEHIIRREFGLNRIRDYIQANPANWDADAENPARKSGATDSIAQIIQEDLTPPDESDES